MTARTLDDLFPTLGTAWRWWIEELAGLVPAGWSLSRKPRADIRPGREEVTIVRIAGSKGERLTESRPLSAFDAEQWQEMAGLLAGHRVRILLTTPLAHCVTLKVPRSAGVSIRDTLPHLLADHAPLPLDRLLWTIADRRTDGEMTIVRVAMTKLETTLAIEAGFQAHDLPLPPIFAELADGRLAPLHRTQGTFDWKQPWLWAALILAATPLLMGLVLYLLVLHDRSVVDALEQSAQPNIIAERHIREQAKVARGLDRLLATPAVTDLVESLADRLPPSAHATDISMRKDGTIEIDLSTTDVEAARAALMGDPHLADVRQLDEIQGATGTPTVRFEARLR